ncbi:hypothetical protein [Selenomonas sp. GACV-9]|uniref:hypothetical protein n=1 Tax=Selenomonas sp. GACV-9 TaxID=3158782 RepID=UPI0015A51A44
MGGAFALAHQGFAGQEDLVGGLSLDVFRHMLNQVFKLHSVVLSVKMGYFLLYNIFREEGNRVFRRLSLDLFRFETPVLLNSVLAV